MEAPERARSMAARSARPTSFLSCHRTSMWAPRWGGTFWFQIFIQAPSPEIWSETISGGEEVLAGKWGGLFWATSLEKIFGGVIAICAAAYNAFTTGPLPNYQRRVYSPEYKSVR